VVKKKKSGPSIHKSIKERLGYDPNDADEAVYKDWNERKRLVCKPCWELKYCPYGPLVEQSPILPSLRAESAEQIAYFQRCIAADTVGNEDPLSDERREHLERWLDDEQTILMQARTSLAHKLSLKHASSKGSEEEMIGTWLGGSLPPIEQYRTPFNNEITEVIENNYQSDQWDQILDEATIIRNSHAKALETGIEDNRQPLEPARKAWFKKVVDKFNADNHPEMIPSTFEEGSCNIFGHICPVFFASESVTETSEERRMGRTRMPFPMMMRIVRRDDYRCQHCKKQLRDDEVEFDHIIPVSRGGSSEEHNMRLTCYDCNRDKGDDYTP